MSPTGHVVALDPAQKAELKGIYADIVQAYSNGQVEVLRDFRRGLPEKVEFIGRDDLIEVGRLFLDVLHVELFEKWLDEFSNIPRHAIPNAKPPMKGDAVNSIRTPLY